jgi:hypothetical protein
MSAEPSPATGRSRRSPTTRPTTSAPGPTSAAVSTTRRSGGRSRRARHRSRRVRRGHPGGGVAAAARRAAVDPVPEPRFADPARGVLAYPLLPGRSLLGRTPPAGAATHLGGCWRSCTPSTRPPSRFRLRRPTAGVAGRLSGPPDCCGCCTPTAAAHRRAGARPRRPRAEHILAADRRLTGVIDWSDAAVTDPRSTSPAPTATSAPRSSTRCCAPTAATLPAFRRRITFFARCAPSKTSPTATRPTPAPPPAA